MLLTIRVPKFVSREDSSSMCSGCGFIVSAENQVLSASVIVRRNGCSRVSPTTNCS